MKKTILALIFAVLVFALAACNTNQKQTATSPDSYTLALELSEDCKTVEISETVTYNNDTGADLTDLKFHLYPDAYRSDSQNCAFFTKLPRYGGIRITSVMSGETALAYEASGTVLTATLPSTLSADSSATLMIKATLDLPESNLRLGVKNGVIKLANFYPVLCVYENGGWRTDEYCKVGDPFYRECADYNVSLTCPANLIVASSGEQGTVTDLGNGRKTVFITGKSLRDFAIAASKDFKTVQAIEGDTTIKYYYTGDTARETEVATAQKALSAFGSVMSAYPYAVYTLVETEFYYNSAEFGNLVVLSKSATDKTDLIVHETAHQWFGGIVGADNVNNGWQNEALASFLTNYYTYLTGDRKAYEVLRENDKSEYIGYQTAQQQSNADGSFAISRPVYQYATNYEYGMITMKKGSLVFDAVLQTVGKDKMNKALKAYCTAYAYRNAGVQQMLDTFDAATKQDVSGIVHCWLDEKTLIAGAFTAKNDLTNA